MSDTSITVLPSEGKKPRKPRGRRYADEYPKVPATKHSADVPALKRFRVKSIQQLQQRLVLLVRNLESGRVDEHLDRCRVLISAYSLLLSSLKTSELDAILERLERIEAERRE